LELDFFGELLCFFFFFFSFPDAGALPTVGG
jgi:hypothetical protein